MKNLESNFGINPEKYITPEITETNGESLKNLPEIYKDFYISKDEKLINSEYSHPIYKNNYEIPVLVLASTPAEIKKSKNNRSAMINYEGYYDENGYPYTTYEQCEKGLENYYFFENKGKPIYVFDNHTHALFAWQEAKEAGLIREKTALIRFDAHPDLSPCYSFNIKSRKNIKEAIASESESLNFKNFTEPALRNNLVSKMYYSSGLPDIDITKLKKQKGFYNDQIEVIKEYADKNRLKDISAAMLKSPEYLHELINELKEENYDIILDIDFDIFSRENTEKFLEAFSCAVKQVNITTCATSPHYADQKQAIEMLKKFLENTLEESKNH
ncbi:MAG: UPF0489 family protein [Candidatus Pacebacteria bacterium]|nr:UPF0489 family protein [Candidatus Paceibacterota bacterium]